MLVSGLFLPKTRPSSEYLRTAVMSKIVCKVRRFNNFRRKKRIVGCTDRVMLHEIYMARDSCLAKCQVVVKDAALFEWDLA